MDGTSTRESARTAQEQLALAGFDAASTADLYGSVGSDHGDIDQELVEWLKRGLSLNDLTTGEYLQGAVEGGLAPLDVPEDQAMPEATETTRFATDGLFQFPCAPDEPELARNMCLSRLPEPE